MIHYGNVENGRSTDGKQIFVPMEKLSAFPQPANTVSHSSAPLTVDTHTHSTYYCY